MNTPDTNWPRPIREPDEADYAPDPADMTFTEATICENIKNCGGEFDTLNEVIREMVFQMLKHWGFFANRNTIDIAIAVKDCEEAVTWIEQPRANIDFTRMAPHIVSPRNNIDVFPRSSNTITLVGGLGSMYGATSLSITHTPKEGV